MLMSLHCSYSTMISCRNKMVEKCDIVVICILFMNSMINIIGICCFIFFFFSSRRRHTRFDCDWSSDVCSSDLGDLVVAVEPADHEHLLEELRRLRQCEELARLQADGNEEVARALRRAERHRRDRKSVV